jgi:hypothetical protein
VKKQVKTQGILVKTNKDYRLYLVHETPWEDFEFNHTKDHREVEPIMLKDQPSFMSNPSEPVRAFSVHEGALLCFLVGDRLLQVYRSTSLEKIGAWEVEPSSSTKIFVLSETQFILVAVKFTLYSVKWVKSPAGDEVIKLTQDGEVLAWDFHTHCKMVFISHRA